MCIRDRYNWSNRFDKGYIPVQYVPEKYQIVYIQRNETEDYCFNIKLGRWVNKDKQKFFEKLKFNQYTNAINQNLLQKYADFSSAAKLVELLQKIPNFRIQLTNEEMEAIGQSGNVLVIGRSGTGKTTCCILRLFSMEMLFKIRLTLYKNQNQNILRDTRFDADDVDNTIGLHAVFVTSSPVLTNEVKRYYKKLTDQIKDELKKKKEREKQKKVLHKRRINETIKSPIITKHQ
eukprot:TRINITY_DN24176_c0_g1_i2.p1 TRINITY_DN24176_c0_g1~~TRINITY_DN24176_c0_g1_i2.p1  ORF type:complete len:233 (-),score=36.35 TRINITY_DN24176_c0_g1_i2:115-813(-)